jgi:hypothetical protein
MRSLLASRFRRNAGTLRQDHLQELGERLDLDRPSTVDFLLNAPFRE